MIQSKRLLRCLLKTISKNEGAEIARNFKDAVIERFKGFENTDEMRDLSLQLLISLFGPNSMTSFSLKKHLDLALVFSQRLQKDEISAYLKYLEKELEETDVSKHFPNGDEAQVIEIK